MIRELAWHLRSRLPRLAGLGLRLLHARMLAGLRLEAAWAQAQAACRRSAPPLRVAVTACWRFPIYSQTFVQQEAAALAASGVELRFFHEETGPRSELAHPCRILWPLRRRLVLDRETGARDLAHFERRTPGRVRRLLEHLAQATGLSTQALRGHEHVLCAFSFARAMRAWRADYLHSYFFYEQSLFVWVAAQLLERPRGVSCYADHLLQDYPLKAVARQLADSAVIVATSRRIADELEALHGGPLPGLLVKPNAVDIRSFPPRPPAAPHAAVPQPLRLLTVCRLDPKKGLEHLLDALLHLHARGLPLRVHVAGEADRAQPEARAYEAALRARAAPLEAAGVLRFLGRCDSHQVRAELQAAEVFVAPFVELANGDKDGIPTAVLEAMAAGCAIVATDAGSIPEIVADGREGLLVPQRDPAALAEALAALATDPARARALGQAARVRAQREFDIAVCEQPFHAAVQAAVRTTAAARPPTSAR